MPRAGTEATRAGRSARCLRTAANGRTGREQGDHAAIDRPARHEDLAPGGDLEQVASE